MTDVLEAMAKLKVRSIPGGLEVDAEALKRNEYQVRYWALTDDGDGMWTHAQSATSGPLGELLHVIVLCYATMPSDLGGR